MTLPAPLVSLLMPACQAHRTIVDAVESVTRNRLDAWQLLVQSDDGSDYSYLRSLFGPRVVVLPPEDGIGPGPARNRCLRAAEGSLIGLLDATDQLDGGYLDTLVPDALRHGAAYAITRFFSGSHSVRMIVPPERFGADFFVTANGTVRGLVEHRHAGFFGEGLCEDAVFEALAVRTSGREAVRANALYHARVNLEAEALLTDAYLAQQYQQGQAFAARLSGAGLTTLTLELLQERMRLLASFRALGKAGESFHEFVVRESGADSLRAWPGGTRAAAAMNGQSVLERARSNSGIQAA